MRGPHLPERSRLLRGVDRGAPSPTRSDGFGRPRSDEARPHPRVRRSARDLGNPASPHHVGHRPEADAQVRWVASSPSPHDDDGERSTDRADDASRGCPATASASSSSRIASGGASLGTVGRARSLVRVWLCGSRFQLLCDHGSLGVASGAGAPRGSGLGTGFIVLREAAARNEPRPLSFPSHFDPLRPHLFVIQHGKR